MIVWLDLQQQPTDGSVACVAASVHAAITHWPPLMPRLKEPLFHKDGMHLSADRVTACRRPWALV
ncbi:MAG: hypothetical protein WCK53_01890 [Methanomicrobiales archaeon]